MTDLQRTGRKRNASEYAAGAPLYAPMIRTNSVVVNGQPLGVCTSFTPVVCEYNNDTKGLQQGLENRGHYVRTGNICSINVYFAWSTKGGITNEQIGFKLPIPRRPNTTAMLNILNTDGITFMGTHAFISVPSSTNYDYVYLLDNGVILTGASLGPAGTMFITGTYCTN